jgi:hypothetical protein
VTRPWRFRLQAKVQFAFTVATNATTSIPSSLIDDHRLSNFQAIQSEIHEPRDRRREGAFALDAGVTAEFALGFGILVEARRLPAS